MVLLWLAGNALRLTVLSIPPVLPAIHDALRLNEAEVGALSNMPPLLLALGAIFGSLLVARLGARRALLAGLSVVAVAGAVRVVGPSLSLLFGATLVMGLGISVSQPALPSLVRAWLPARSGLATAVYSNGFLVGEIVGAAATAPLLVELLGGWRPAVAIWSVPVLGTALAVVLLTRELPEGHETLTTRWWPDWRDPLTWRLGLVLGCAAAVYFGSNAFVPDYLRTTGNGSLITPALTTLNATQLPASVITAIFPAQLIGRRWPLVGAGLLMALSVGGFLLGGVWVVIWSATMGLGVAFVFVLTLALPPVVAGPDEVHRLTAAMFTISYTLPFVGSISGGALWDLTSTPALAFAPMLVAALALSLLARGLRVAALA